LRLNLSASVDCFKTSEKSTAALQITGKSATAPAYAFRAFTYNRLGLLRQQTGPREFSQAVPHLSLPIYL
jgi:hypothetical protein